LNEDSIEFSLSTQTRRVSKSSRLSYYIRPREEINQNILSTPTKNRDNLSSRIEIDPRITDNRTPEKAIRIFGSYQRHKKRNNKEHNLLRTPIKYIKQNTNKENKTIWIT